MRLTHFAIALATLTAAPAFAAGDIAKGEAVFKTCQACHVIADADGKVLGGMGKVGPNLHGLFGRQAGSLEGFNYGKDLEALGETGLIWDEALFVEYVQDPANFLKTKLDKSNARSKMSFKLKGDEKVADVYAYLAQFSPPPAEAEAAAPAPTN
jgi:cytochrome c